MDTLKLIYAAIDEMNLDLEPENQIVKAEDTQIFGGPAALDSLQLVNLITILEQMVEEETGDFISIADEKAMSMESSPFKSIQTLKDYLELLLNENN